MWRNITVICPPTLDIWLPRKEQKKRIRATLQMWISAESSPFSDIRFTFSSTCRDDEENVSLWGSQSKVLFSRLQKVRWSLLYLAVWVVSSPLALFYHCQIFHPNLATFANSRVYPPKQNKQILSPPVSMFCCCHCFIRCLALLCDKCKMKSKLMLSSYLIQANFECTCALTSYNVANRSTSS